MIPSQKDIDKRKQKLKDFLSKIDPETGVSKEKDMIQVVRGAIRKSWMRSPTKLAYLYSKSEPDMDEESRRKWKIQCECCKEYFKEADVEVDHIDGNHSFRTVDDFENYFNKILMIGFDDLQILCKECHEIKTLQEKLGITFKEARAHKIAISIQKEKREKEWLIEQGLVPEKNQVKRRLQIVEFLLR